MSYRSTYRDRGSSPGLGGPADRSRGRGSPVLSSGHDTFTSSGYRGRGGWGGGSTDGGHRGGGSSDTGIFAENVQLQIPAPLSGPEQQKPIDGSKFIIIKPERPLRPRYGTVGTPITLRTNFLAMKVPQGPIYDYVVKITPEHRIRIRRVLELLELSPLCQPYLPHIAHDRTQRLVSAKELPQPLDIPIPFYKDNRAGPAANATVYTVSIKFKRELDSRQLTKYMDGQADSRDYNTLPLISALNLVVQQHVRRVAVRVGKNRYFFPTSQERYSLGPGVEAVQGFYTSVRPALTRLMVNVNVCMKAFIMPGNLAQRLLEFRHNSRGGMPTLPRTMVRRIKIKALHLGYKKKLYAIGNLSARETTFDSQECGGRITVEDYFKKKYGKTLRYPDDLPLVDVGAPGRPNWIPAELCEIEPGTVLWGNPSDKETTQMIKYASNPPKPNAQAIINRGLPSLGINPVESPIPEFGIQIDNKLTYIPGRELPPPGLRYKVGQATPRDGSWNILDVKFHRAAIVLSWWVLVVWDGRNIVQGPHDSRLKSLVEGFATKMTKNGIALPRMPHVWLSADLSIFRNDPERRSALNAIRQTFKMELSKRFKPSFVLVLLENRDNFIYPGIKRIGDVELGINTIHMQLEKAFGSPNKQDQYFSNVALKVNTKLGGVNHLLDDRAMKWLTKEKTMMVGINVAHPCQGSRDGTPSIAAVVASVDDSFVQFPASLRIQQTKKEMVDELRDMLLERLLFYEKKNRTLPARIIVYRNGLSEGQFNTVLREELPQILEAFKQLSTKQLKNYRPQVSIICAKRHHARFFPTDSVHASKNGNTKPGTVVDKGVTGVFDYDFYLQAHAGVQGHVKAMHYTVVYDENNLQADELQQGTHDASYLYARATRALSLVPAAYYAYLACKRGRCYLNDFWRGTLDEGEEAKRVFEAAQNAWGEGLHPDMKGSMFYI